MPGCASISSGATGAALDFGEEREIAPLRRLWESLELEIIRVLEASNALKESPDYELHRLTTQTPGVFLRDGAEAGRVLGEGIGATGEGGGGVGEGD